MHGSGLRSIALRIALAVLNLAAAISLQVLMWRNKLWDEKSWTKKT